MYDKIVLCKVGDNMDNDILLFVITCYVLGVVAIIFVLNLMQFYSKRKYKNEIIDAPIMSELSKVETYKTKNIKEKYEVWKKEIDDMKKNLDTNINDMILDADFSLDRKDFNDYLKKKINIEIKLYEAREQKQRLLDEIQETVNRFLAIIMVSYGDVWKLDDE